MFRTISALALTVFCVLFANTYLRTQWMNSFWGSRSAMIKFRYLQEAQQNFNIVLFGDSRTELHLDPTILDAELADVGDFRVFNAGSPALTMLESSYQYRRMLEENIFRPRYALIQVNAIGEMGDDAIGRGRGRYWLDFAAFRTFLSALPESRYASDREWTARKRIVRFYVERLLNINMLANTRTIQSSSIDSYIGKGKNGFHTLEELQGDYWLQQASSDFFRDDAIYRTMMKQEKRILSDSCPADFSTHMRVLQDIIDLSTAYDVYPIFFMPAPGWSTQARCIVEHIPAQYVLPMVTSENHPELFEKNDFIYQYHWNKQNAARYAHVVGALFAEKIRSLPSL